MTTSSSSIHYLPIPPRVWSRVQNQCSLNMGLGNNSNYAVFDFKRQSLLKGNILQYKKNSSNLTKKQRYSQIAKGMWTNRTTTWATQSDSYTNPNTTSLQRVNYTIIDPSNNIYSNPPNPFFAYGCLSTEIKEGGTLVCNTTVNPCTDVIVSQTLSQKLCNPTTDSDVPGAIIDLCWNDGDPTWYPRQRYVMSTSSDKWPVNSKALVSAIHPNPPILLSITVIDNSVILQWESGNNDCYPVQEFYIYDNDILIQVVPYPSLVTKVYDLFNCSTNVFYVTAVIYKRESPPSNSLSAFIDLPYGPIITSYSSACNTGIILNWEMAQPPCLPIINFNIYEIGSTVPIQTTSASVFTYTITTLTTCQSYSFFITAVFSNLTESTPSPTVVVNLNPCPPSLSSGTITETTVEINLSAPSPASICTITSYDLFKDSSFLINISASGPYLYTSTGLSSGTTYTFYAYSIGSPNKSIKSNVLTVTTTPHTKPAPPTNLSFTTCYKQATLSWTLDPFVIGYKLYLGSVLKGTVGLVDNYTYTGLTNGNSTPYSLTVIAYTNGEESLPSSINATLPTTQSYFSLSGGFAFEITEFNYIVNFSSLGSITYNTLCASVNVTNCSLTIVGGGGGGAGGKPNTNSGGGGGGGEVSVQTITFTPGSIANVTLVGSAGQKGLYSFSGTAGASTSATFGSSTFTVSGGGGGNVNGAGGTGLGASGGQGANVNFGNGGNGFDGGPGSASFAGAGGGGSYPTTYSLGTGGQSGYDAAGGGGGKMLSLSNPNGVSATTPGCGGGGGVSFEPHIKGAGGNGGQGAVKFVIPN